MEVVFTTAMAADLIEYLKKLYHENHCHNFLFQFNARPHIAGSERTELRRFIIQHITGELISDYKATEFRTLEVLTNSFKQYQLF